MLLTTKMSLLLQSDNCPYPDWYSESSGGQRVEGNLNLVIRAGEVE